MFSLFEILYELPIKYWKVQTPYHTKTFIIWAQNLLCHNHCDYFIFPIVGIPTASISVNHRLLMSLCVSNAFPLLECLLPNHVTGKHIKMEPVIQIDFFFLLYVFVKVLQVFSFIVYAASGLSLSFSFTFLHLRRYILNYTIFYLPSWIFFTYSQYSSVNFKAP